MRVFVHPAGDRHLHLPKRVAARGRRGVPSVRGAVPRQRLPAGLRAAALRQLLPRPAHLRRLRPQGRLAVAPAGAPRRRAPRASRQMTRGVELDALILKTMINAKFVLNTHLLQVIVMYVLKVLYAMFKSSFISC